MAVTITVTRDPDIARFLDGLQRQLTSASSLAVGYLSGKTYPDGTPLAQVASNNEFGEPARGVPPRPFFRNMIAAHQNEWPDRLGQALIDNDYDARAALDVVGTTIEVDLRQSILDTNDPPNAPSTIARKGHDKPLIDSGLMFSEIEHEVK